MVTVGIHAVLLVAFFLMLAWVEPDPPIPEYGIELSFATTPSTNSSEAMDTPEETETEAEISASDKPTESEDSSPEEQIAATESESAEEENTETQQDETVTTDDVNSPDVVEESTVAEEQTEEEAVSQPAEEDVADNPETVESTDASTSEASETLQQQKVIDERAIFKKGDTNEGEDNKGSSLDLAGWDWDFLPEPNDNSTENGKIVFQITIDGDGEIVGIKTLEKTVSPAVVKVYEDAVRELTFHKTADNKVAAATSTGKITFIIKSR